MAGSAVRYSPFINENEKCSGGSTMSNRPSRGEDWFRDLQAQSNQAAFLKSLVNSTPPTFEDEHLDFKGADKLTDTDIKRLWSKSLSGFGNTAGGVLVWGIDARKDNATGVDCASGLSLVPDPPVLLSRLKELQHQACDPPVQGVEYLHCVDPADKGPGFVVCFVPESPFKPHRAELCKKSFFIRVGDSFVEPNVAILRSMFYPHTHSWLWVEMAVTTCVEDQRGYSVAIEARIHNTGTATASNVLVVVQTERNGGFEPAVNWQKIGTPQGKVGFVSPGLPLHPGQASQVFRYCDLQLRVADTEFRLLLYAENREPLETTIRFTRDDLDDRIRIEGESTVGTWHRASTP